MDGRTDGRVDKWTDRLEDEQAGERTGGRTDKLMGGRTQTSMKEHVDGPVDERIDELRN